MIKGILREDFSAVKLVIFNLLLYILTDRAEVNSLGKSYISTDYLHIGELLRLGFRNC